MRQDVGVLTAVLKHATTESSAHQSARAETEQWNSIAQLVGEYETIAQTAQLERWHALLERGDLPQAVIEELIDSDTFGILTAELRRLDAEGHDIDNLLPRIIRAGGLEDADDLATLIRSRLLRVSNRYRPVQPAAEAHLIAGIFPNAAGVHDATFVRALLEREHLIDARAKELAQGALKGVQPWHAQLPPLKDQREQSTWLLHVAVIAAYRDRWQVTSMTPLGPKPDSDMQLRDRQRAADHLRALTDIEGRAPDGDHNLERVPPRRSM